MTTIRVNWLNCYSEMLLLVSGIQVGNRRRLWIILDSGSYMKAGLLCLNDGVQWQRLWPKSSQLLNNSLSEQSTGFILLI
ncbi:hypothetical protein C0J52_06925 [Blattella germanica]|nr:hypothetical protein C0J52_06925 [Blattella germanica]